MASHSLRDYQVQAVDAVREAWSSGVKRPAVVQATGTGKTVVLSAIISDMVRNEKRRPLVIAHRQELLSQTAEKLLRVDRHLSVGTIQADRHEVEAEVVVASIQSISRRLGVGARAIDPSRFDLIIVDEAHHAAAKTYLATLEHFGAMNPDSNTLALGVTATLSRTDNIPLGHIWQEVCFEYSAHDAITDGYLVRPLAQRVILADLDLSKVKTVAGDFSEGDLGKKMYRSGMQIGAAIMEHGLGPNGRPRRGITFAPTIECANQWAYDFNSMGIRSDVVIGATPTDQRQDSYRKLADHRIDMLVSVMVLTEGFDLPAVEMCVMGRPTKSMPLYVQCLDSVTEVLTDRGWLGSDSDWSEARAAAYDPRNDSIHWSEVLSRANRRLRPGESMMGVSSPTADIRVTDQHRMVWAGRSQPWRITTASEMSSRKSGYSIPISGYQDAPGVPLLDDEIRFIGWVMTDGSINRVNKQVCISKSVHQPMNKDIVAMLNGCGLKWRLHALKPQGRFNETSIRQIYTVSYGKPRGEDKHLTGWGHLEPWLAKDLSPLLEDMTRQQLSVLLEAMHLGDGSKQLGQTWTRRSYHISTANAVMAERLQSLCVRRGFKANVSTHYYNENPIHVLHIKDVRTKTIDGSNTTDRESFGPVPFVEGERVWCVEVDTGVIVTRRNGKVAVVGNCIGRVLRPSPETGKVDALILDLCGTIQDKITTLIDLDIPDVCCCDCGCEFEHLCVMRCACPRTKSGKLKRPCVVCRKNRHQGECLHYDHRHVAGCPHTCEGVGKPGQWDEDPVEEEVVLDAAGNPIEWDVDHSEVRLKSVDLFDSTGAPIARRPVVRRKTAWLMTNGGVPFLPSTSTTDETIFLWPGDGAWTVGSKPRRGQAVRLESGLAFAEAVKAANALHPTGGKPSRPLVGPATEGQLTMLGNCGVPMYDGMSKQDASVAISVALASRALDGS